MTKLSLIGITLFVLLLFLQNVLVSAGEIVEKRKLGDKKYSPLWFGPRIGRKKRLDNEAVDKTTGEDVLLDFIRNNLWTVKNLGNSK